MSKYTNKYLELNLYLARLLSDIFIKKYSKKRVLELLKKKRNGVKKWLDEGYKKRALLLIENTIDYVKRININRLRVK